MAYSPRCPRQYLQYLTILGHTSERTDQHAGCRLIINTPNHQFCVHCRRLGQVARVETVSKVCFGKFNVRRVDCFCNSSMTP